MPNNNATINFLRISRHLIANPPSKKERNGEFNFIE